MAGEANTTQALGDVKKVIQRSWDRHRHRQETPPSPWISVLPFLLMGLLAAVIFVSARREQRALAELNGGKKPVRSNASL